MLKGHCKSYTKRYRRFTNSALVVSKIVKVTLKAFKYKVTVNLDFNNPLFRIALLILRV
jgi:hypothetical protein